MNRIIHPSRAISRGNPIASPPERAVALADKAAQCTRAAGPCAPGRGRERGIEMSKLVIAEKPAMARDIARAVCGVPVPEDARLPVSGGYVVAACSGHLLELAEPSEVDAKWAAPWREDALPVVVPDWPKVPRAGKEGLIGEMARLLEGADGVVHAGDPDDEGQPIVDDLLDYLGYGGPVERAFANDSMHRGIIVSRILADTWDCARRRPCSECEGGEASVEEDEARGGCA